MLGHQSSLDMPHTIAVRLVLLCTGHLLISFTDRLLSVKGMMPAYDLPP